MESTSPEKLRGSGRDRARSGILWAGVVGWLISRFFRKSQKASVTLAKKAERQLSQQFTSGRVTTQAKSERGILSLVLELFGAIAIKLVQRFFKSWRSTLIESLENPKKTESAFEALPDKAAPKYSSNLADDGSGISPERSSQKSFIKKG